MSILIDRHSREGGNPVFQHSFEKIVHKLDPRLRGGDDFRGDDVTLEKVVSPEPVPNGFYVASGSHDLVRQVLTRVVHLFKKESESAATSMESRNHMGRLFWIDSGNTFDAYHVARTAAEQGMDSRRVLRAIQVARPFTAFQFQQMLGKVPQPTLWSGHRVVTYQPLVIISDLMGLFYDEEIQENDVQRAFQKFTQSLSRLGERALVLALMLDHSVPYQRRAMVSQTLRLARRVAVQPARQLPVAVGE